MLSSSLLRTFLRRGALPLRHRSTSASVQLSQPRLKPLHTSSPQARRPDKIIPPIQGSRPQPKTKPSYTNRESFPNNAKPLITEEQLRKAVQSPQTAWVVVIVVGAGIVFYYSNQEIVPVSGRKRFNCYSEESVNADSAVFYRQIMQEAKNSILPAWDPRARKVERVLKRLIPAIGTDSGDWEVHVIESPEANAFVIPGNKVFVFTGILPIASTDDMLAAVMGHEIAHNLAQHQAESKSSRVLLEPIRWLLYYLDASGLTFGLGGLVGHLILSYGVMAPASRAQESEADYIGLILMAKSCYNPESALSFWQRMEHASGNEIPEWMSTHPSNPSRIAQMKAWLPEALEAREASDCRATIGYAKDFRAAFGNPKMLW